MKKQLDIKKLLLLNMPYILMGLFATNFGEAWRMAVGADASAKMLSFFSTLPVALASWWPSLHPLDLVVGLCCGGGLRLAVYLKSKNAKKYRHGMEYGSARWGTPVSYTHLDVYKRQVVDRAEWPRKLDTLMRGTSLLMSRLAKVCPYGIITTNRKSPVESRALKKVCFSQTKDIPFSCMSKNQG